MTYAAITGWGKCMPPAVLTNADLATFLGAARLAAASPEPASVLRERVTSKGGTTAAALASLDADQVKAGIVRALHAANARARELGDELDR